MNKEAIRKTANAIAAQTRRKSCDVGFNMNVFYDDGEIHGDKMGHKCNTVACIAGWTVLTNDKDYPLAAGTFREIEEVARRILDLDPKESKQLFFRQSERTKLKNTTPQHAVAVLRHLAKTGEVDWQRFNRKGELRK